MIEFGKFLCGKTLGGGLRAALKEREWCGERERDGEFVCRG